MNAVERRRADLAKLFPGYVAQIRMATEDLHRRRPGNVDKRLETWYGNWIAAYSGMLLAASIDLIEFGLMLGRFAESHSRHDLAESVLDQLAEDAVRKAEWVENPARILITAGEFRRRRGDLQAAERRFEEAVDILEADVFNEHTRNSAHWELGRVFYELGYLHRLRGDAAAASAAFDRSEIECELAGDAVGVEIARSQNATRLFEEGMAPAAVAQYEASVQRFQELIVDPTVQALRRDNFARRWLLNVRIHLSQAYLAAGNHAQATRLIEGLATEVSEGPSALALATTKRIEAQIWLAQNEIQKAESAITVSRDVIILHDEPITEQAAATLAVVGVIHALHGDTDSALSCFHDACELPAELHNHRAQAWGWAGRAILLKAKGETAEARGAILRGLACVERCGAPIRSFLLNLLRANHRPAGPDLEALRLLVSTTG